MKRMPFAPILILLIISSCTAAPQATVVQPTETIVVDLPTQSPEPTLELSAQPTGSSTAGAMDPAGKIVFKIIPGESQVQYEVGETFLNDNRFAVAVGITPEVNGEIFADLENPSASTLGPIAVNISQFQSDSSRRDNTIRERFLESSRYPIATFTPAKIESLPESYQEGQDYAIKVTGDLTVREMTLPVPFDVTARLQDNVVTGTAVSNILMSDFKVGPISLVGMLNTEDQVKLTFRFVAKP